MLLMANRLQLKLRSPQEALAWVETLPAEVRVEISSIWLEQLQNSKGPDPWTCGFQIRKKENDEEVGSCAFKGPPDQDGCIEIGYGIDEAYRNIGFATESVQRLVQYALSLKDVSTVRAHSKPENAASERVLSKCGFRCLGLVEDPEDGKVNRWEIQRH